MRLETGVLRGNPVTKFGFECFLARGAVRRIVPRPKGLVLLGRKNHGVQVPAFSTNTGARLACPQRLPNRFWASVALTRMTLLQSNGHFSHLLGQDTGGDGHHRHSQHSPLPKEGSWPGFPVLGLHRQLTLAGRTHAATGSFLARSRTHAVGQ